MYRLSSCVLRLVQPSGQHAPLPLGYELAFWGFRGDAGSHACWSETVAGHSRLVGLHRFRPVSQSFVPKVFPILGARAWPAPIIHGVDGPIKLMPADSRINFKNVTCATDGALRTYQNSFDKSGFVVCPGVSFLLNTINPLVDRPDCRSPFAN
jgi:hypothetical protein